jgi:hypothetical protein
MAEQVSFDFFAAMLYTLLKGKDIELKWAVSVAAAASASVLACAFSQPMSRRIRVVDSFNAPAQHLNTQYHDFKRS